MHELEPFFNWRHLYIAEEDEQSPFYGTEHSEFMFTHTVYNYYIHPQWDEIGSKTLYLKVLFVDYEANYAIIEMIGEWNDAIENDIMSLKRNLIDYLTVKGIYKFVFITENVLNYHSGDTDYYEEWTEEINEENGWIVLLNMPEQTKYDFLHSKIKKYLFFYENYEWRTYRPDVLFQWVDSQIWKRLM